MAKVSDLRLGGEYATTAKKSRSVSARRATGENITIPVGETVVVLTNSVEADGTAFARCIQAEYNGEVIYLLPKLLSDGTIAVSVPTPTAQAPTPVATRTVLPITDPMDDRLDRYRPDATLAKEYVSRKFSGVKDTDLLLKVWRDTDRRGYRRNVLLVGDTQAGKTMLVQVLAILTAKEMGLPKPLPVFTISGSAGVSDMDLLGQSVAHIGSDGVERLVYLNGIVELASKVPCILYLDEINMMPERVTSTLHPVCDDRRSFLNRAKAVELGGEFLMDETKMNPGCWIIGTMNPPGYRGTSPLNEAFANRFTVQLPWGYDKDVETRLVGSASLLLLGDALREARRLNSITQPVGTKMLMDTKAFIGLFGVDVAMDMFYGFFSDRDRAKVQAICNDKSIVSLLREEFATPDTSVPTTSDDQQVV